MMDKTAGWAGETRTLAICAALATLAIVSRAECVKYAGIFINDEDWGLRPWAVKHFGKKEQIGTQTYEMVFALMKECGLNFIWPAMHEGGYEFVSRPENMALAAKHGITIGTSHCEPMLRNNCYLSKGDKKKWSWLGNRDFIKDYWQWSVDRYATNDVLWTIGMRGIHDGKMQDGTNTSHKIEILEDVFAVQCAMLEAAGKKDAPKLFVPYKEVLPIFNAGLKVPDGTTIMWVNDNFGYVRRLGGPQCDGYGGGIYWHASYHGRPHGYIHLCTTPPAFMWYELVAKCWQNGVRDVWMVNVGDVFQAEIIMYALGKFASDPEKWMAQGTPQDEILKMWAGDALAVKDQKTAERIAAHLGEYFNLGFIRKPEHMSVYWTRKLPQKLKEKLKSRYRTLLAEDKAVEAALPEEMRDTYFRKIGFQVRFLAHTGLIHLEGRDREYARSVIDPLHKRWDSIEGGKWSRFWCDTIDENGGMRQPTEHNRWSSQMQWPWNEPADPAKKDRHGESRDSYGASATAYDGTPEPKWLEPAENIPANGGAWRAVKGLGTSSNALALLPVKPGIGEGSALVYGIGNEECSSLIMQFLPDFALWPGMKLRVKIAFDDGEPLIVEVPKSDSNLGEKDPVRNTAVQDNFIRVKTKIPEGAKKVKITAVDPGVVIDQVGISSGF